MTHGNSNPNSNTIELICFVTQLKYMANFSRLSKATWLVIMAIGAMNRIVAMVSYIYCGKSVVQVLSLRGEAWVSHSWDSFPMIISSIPLLNCK